MTEGTKRFLHGLWMGTVGVGFLIYWINARQLEGVWALIRDAAPSILFVAGAILIADRDRRTTRRRRRVGEDSDVVVLTGRDAMVNDVLAYLTGALILAVPLALGRVDGLDIIQAVIAVGALSWIRWYYFQKSNRGY